MFLYKKSQAGFTIAELIIAITAGTVVALSVLSVTLFFLADMMATNAETQLTLEAQNINRLIVEDLRTSTRILSSNSITDANAPSGGWTTSQPNHILIVSNPSTNSANEFIFNTDSGEPYQDELIYYTVDSNLYKRTLANPAATNNSKQTSCPEAVATASCPADRLLSTNFSQMDFSFFDQDNNPTTTISAARSIDMTINLQQSVFGRMPTAKNEIRITLRNPT